MPVSRPQDNFRQLFRYKIPKQTASEFFISVFVGSPIFFAAFADERNLCAQKFFANASRVNKIGCNISAYMVQFYRYFHW